MASGLPMYRGPFARHAHDAAQESEGCFPFVVIAPCSMRGDNPALEPSLSARAYATTDFAAAIEAAIGVRAQLNSTLHESSASTCSGTKQPSAFPSARGMCDMPADSF